MLQVTSCATKIKNEIKYVMPEYNLPDFPVCNDFRVLNDNEVVIDADFFISLAKFKNEYEEYCEWYSITMQLINEE